MRKYQVEFEGEPDNLIFNTYEDAKKYAEGCRRAVTTGIRLLHDIDPYVYASQDNELEYRIVVAEIH